MGVEEEDAGRAAQQALLEDLPRLDRRAVESAAVDLALAEEAAAAVEEERAHDLLVAHAVAQGR